MALVHTIENVALTANRVHDAVECTYTSFTDVDGKRYIQFDTYGSAGRKIPGKKSQSLQFSENSARELVDILRREFGF